MLLHSIINGLKKLTLQGNPADSCRVAASVMVIPIRYAWKAVELPKPGRGRCFRRIVHYPEKYTVEPLRITKLGGRDPVTGRKVVGKIGGGMKQTYLWIDYFRCGPKEGPPLEEKVMKILHDSCRTADVALVASGDKLRYIIATENMKVGDLIKTSGYIPRMTVRPNEGDAYPLGALPMGTCVHCIEKFPGQGGYLVKAAGTFATVMRKVDQQVIVQLPSKHQISVSQECMATVGRVSNIEHNKTPIGSAQANRRLGNRPCSGLWQRKTGRHGRKIKAPPPVKAYTKPLASKPEIMKLTIYGE